jgi:hypothetical protein
MSELRYIRQAGEISRVRSPSYGVKEYVRTPRPPKPVEVLMEGLSDPVEVYYDTKSKAVRIVPLWERLVTW